MGRTFLRHFDYDEFDCYYQENSGYRHMDREFLLMLDEARDICGLKFKILRGYVSPLLIGRDGVKVPSNSPHMLGKAACIWCQHSEKRFRIVASLLEVGFHRIGIGPDYIYVDNDEARPPMMNSFLRDLSLQRFYDKKQRKKKKK